MPDQEKKIDAFTWFLGAATVVLAVLVLLLARQNRALKAQLSAAASIPAGGLHAGETLAPFDVMDAAGNTTHVAFDGKGRTLLLVFSSTCGACQETLPLWNRLLRESPQTTVQVVGIQTDFSEGRAGGGALSTPDLPFAVYHAAEPMGEPMKKFPSIPAAALVDGNGAVTAVWFGVPGEPQVSEMRRALAG